MAVVNRRTFYGKVGKADAIVAALQEGGKLFAKHGVKLSYRDSHGQQQRADGPGGVGVGGGERRGDCRRGAEGESEVAGGVWGVVRQAV